MLPGADLRGFNSAPSRYEKEVQPFEETPEETLARMLFLVERFKTERCRDLRCLCRRKCVKFHDYADRRTCRWADWQQSGYQREPNKTAECYSPYKLKTEACDKEKKGNCPFGANCAFAHVLAGEPLLPRHRRPITREQWVTAARSAIEAHFSRRKALGSVSAAQPGISEPMPVAAADPQYLEVGEYEMAAIDLFPGLVASLAHECGLHGAVFGVERGPGKQGAVVVRLGKAAAATATSTGVSGALLRVGKRLLDLGCDYEFNKTFPHTGHPSVMDALRLHLLKNGQSGFGWNSQHVRVQITPESKVHLRILKHTPEHADVAGVVRRILTGWQLVE